MVGTFKSEYLSRVIAQHGGVVNEDRIPYIVAGNLGPAGFTERQPGGKIVAYIDTGAESMAHKFKRCIEFRLHR